MKSSPKTPNCQYGRFCATHGTIHDTTGDANNNISPEPATPAPIAPENKLPVPGPVSDTSIYHGPFKPPIAAQTEKCFRGCTATADRKLCANNSGLNITVCVCECHNKFDGEGLLELDSAEGCAPLGKPVTSPSIQSSKTDQVDAAQTEKVCSWDVIGDECDCPDCKAEQVDAARLVREVGRELLDLSETTRDKEAAKIIANSVKKLNKLAASLKQETQPPSDAYCKKPRIPGPADAPCALKDGHSGMCQPRYNAASSSPLETPAAVPQEVWFCVGDIDPQPIGSGFATPAPADTGAAKKSGGS